MDQNRIPKLDGGGATIRKKRTQTSRRYKPDGHSIPDRSPRSSTPHSEDTSKVSSDDMGDTNSGGKMFNLNQCVSRSLPVKVSDNGMDVFPNNGTTGDGTGSESRLKKVKLKVGGVTHTIQAKSSSNGASSSGSLQKSNHSSDNGRLRNRTIHQENSDEYHSPHLDKKSGLQGIPWKDFSKVGFTIGKEDKQRKVPAKNSVEKEVDKSDSARKSKRAPKKRVLDVDGEFDDEDVDDEIRYLVKLKTSRLTGGIKDSEATKSGDMDYQQQGGGEVLSDGDQPEGGKKKKKLKKDLSELPVEITREETTLTSRQRALLSKDIPSASGANQIEFPNGLPPAPPRKNKEKLTEVEQQLKKAEAAQKRRIQNEKAARELEQEAIRKILGQDSSRKKREEKIKKRQEEMAQEKATNVEMLTSNTIRIVMGSTGTTVTFPRDLGFPTLFDPKPCSYPPPREKCAGPTCTNSYKYRDSKSKLPLCSLQCYKAINEMARTEKAF